MSKIGLYIYQFIVIFLVFCLFGFAFKFLEMYPYKAFALSLGATILTIINDAIKLVIKKIRLKNKEKRQNW